MYGYTACRLPDVHTVNSGGFLIDQGAFRESGEDIIINTAVFMKNEYYFE